MVMILFIDELLNGRTLEFKKGKDEDQSDR
jgi:hypothetical protein